MSREAWLQQRMSYLTASDAAAIVGLSPYKSVEDLVAEKLGQGQPRNLTLKMWAGTMREEANLKMFSGRTGTVVRPNHDLVISAQHPFMAATPDGFMVGPTPASFQGPPEREACPEILALPDWCLDSGIPLEAKNVESKNRSLWKRPRNWEAVSPRSDDRLFGYWAQVQFQMLVCGKPAGVLFAAVDAAEMYVHPITRDVAFQQLLVDRGQELWDVIQANKDW
jgi:putative phage-type endonuclease